MTTPYGAPEWAASQAAPDATVNEALRMTQGGAGYFRVEDDDLTAPPGSCADGAVYIPAATATGVWTGKEKHLLQAKGVNASNGWSDIPPEEGQRAWIKDENAERYYNGSAWVVPTAPGTGTAATLDFDTDGTLAANSDALLPTQKAVKTAIAAAVVGLFDLKGGTDCSANPNYPAALKGDAYQVTVAGKIGGGSGKSVDVGDVYIASADNAGGTEASVGTSWFVLEHNLVGAASAGAITASGLTMATARILGRTTASTGAVEEISVGAGLSLSGGSLTRAAPAIQSVSSSATVTPTFADDQVIITAQAAALALANPTGTAVDGYGVVIRIKDNGSARAISYGTQYRAIGVTLPTTTVISKTLYLAMIFNSADTKWDVVAVAQEA